ncbi:MAG: phosphohistidine phosphatase SixA, partial [Candidatus Limnocylindrales bacterium]
RPVLVGHDPDVSELIAVLCGAAGVPMRKGTFARVEVDRPMQPGFGTLRWLIPTDLLRPER